jgi:rhodanese-related sulfurtransferase
MMTYKQLVEEYASQIREIMPWDLEQMLASDAPPLLLDVREPYEFQAMHIPGSVNVPRGILESACEYDYEETVPELVCSREREVVVVCRSGYRSVLAAYTMQLLGYSKVCSLKTGVRGWNEYEQPLVDDKEKPVDIDTADEYFTPRISEDQHAPK